MADGLDALMAEMDGVAPPPRAAPVAAAPRTADGGAAGGDDGPEGLIPLCVRQPDGPALNPAVYGYDIALLSERPWAKPGANVSDYFNYGFDELTWRAYCAMQPNGRNAVRLKAEDFIQRQGFTVPTGRDREGMGMGGGPGMGGGGMGGMGGGRMGGETRYGPNGEVLKLRPCFQFRDTGTCQRGEHCGFAHGDEELEYNRRLADEMRARGDSGTGFGDGGRGGGGGGGYGGVGGGGGHYGGPTPGPAGYPSAPMGYGGGGVLPMSGYGAPPPEMPVMPPPTGDGGGFRALPKRPRDE